MFRPARVSDLDAIHQCWSDGAAVSLGAPPTPGIDYRGYFKQRLETQSGLFKFFVVENDSGEVVGWQSLSPLRSHPAVSSFMAELSAYARPGHFLGESTRFGLEQTLHFADRSALHYVIAFVVETNPQALRLATRLGMNRVGTLPRAPRAPHLPELVFLVYPCKSDAG